MPERPEAGVVHEHVDGGRPLFDRGQLCGVGEIGDEHLERAAGVLLTEFLGERVEASAIACDEDEVVTARGEFTRELLTDADGRAGHECKRSCHAVAALGVVRIRSPFTTMRWRALPFG